MSYLEDKVLQVEAFYAKLDQDLADFQTVAKYGCISGCSKCCHAPHIEATILELLPLAFYLYKENTAEKIYDKLEQGTSSSLCALYEPILTGSRKGACSEYPYRALVCRLFGFSFTRDKTGKPNLLTCKDIKTEHTEAHEVITTKAQDGLEVPMASNYYTLLTDIDYHLSLKSYPINEAMRLAIEMVLNHFHYCEPARENYKNVS
jgi:Fe-S-cluster containining protein